MPLDIAARARLATVPVALLIVATTLLVPGVVAAQEDDSGATDETSETGEGVSDDVLLLGAEVYSGTCSGCHQPGGGGITGQFPPLVGNDNVLDTDYLRDVIANGREGELEVDGTVYDGRMPAFSTLPDAEVDALIAYIQGGFAAPTGGGEPGVAVPGGGLPEGAEMAWIAAFVVMAGIAVWVLAPRLTSAHDGREMPWLDAWLKTAVIVIGFIVFTVFVPNWALQTDTVAELDRRLQDLVGTALWMGGLAGCLWALWYAHREKRI